MRNSVLENHTISDLTKKLVNLRIRQIEIDRTLVQQQLSNLKEEDNIGHQHIGRRCLVLNSHKHQPSEGKIVGFTKGIRPFVKIKGKGFVEIRRLPKNLKLLSLKKNKEERSFRKSWQILTTTRVMRKQIMKEKPKQTNHQ